MTAIVDYRAGNLTSVRYAFDALGVATTVTRDPAVVRAADRVVFPGVGAAKSAMESLAELGLADAVRAAAETKPFLGICLGMQILFEHSEEDGGVATLGILPGKVRRFPSVPGFKVPEIGWNSVEQSGSGLQTASGIRISSSSFRSGRETASTLDFALTLASSPEYYFVHSYYAELCPYTAGVTEYAGVKFTAMAKKGRLWACQFHPEKSGRVGLDLLKEWLSC